MNWEIIHWPIGGRMQLCETEQVARNLVSEMKGQLGQGHIVREVRVTKHEKLYKPEWVDPTTSAMGGETSCLNNPDNWYSAGEWGKLVRKKKNRVENGKGKSIQNRNSGDD